ncbi:hypothetical protein Tco_0099234 [Tanacetum coccineum]
MFDELLNGTATVVSKSSTVNAADAPDKRQQQTTTQYYTTIVAVEIPPLNIQTTPETTSLTPTQAPTITATKNINQAETNKESAQLKKTNLSTSLVHLYKNEGRHHLIMLIRQTCILSINDILLNIVGQKIIR